MDAITRETNHSRIDADFNETYTPVDTGWSLD